MTEHEDPYVMCDKCRPIRELLLQGIALEGLTVEDVREAFQRRLKGLVQEGMLALLDGKPVPLCGACARLAKKQGPSQAGDGSQQEK